MIEGSHLLRFDRSPAKPSLVRRCKYIQWYYTAPLGTCQRGRGPQRLWLSIYRDQCFSVIFQQWWTGPSRKVTLSLKKCGILKKVNMVEFSLFSKIIYHNSKSNSVFVWTYPLKETLMDRYDNWPNSWKTPVTTAQKTIGETLVWTTNFLMRCTNRVTMMK